MARPCLTTLLLLAMLPFITPPRAAAQPATDAAHQQFVFAYRLLQRGEPKAAAEAFDEYLGRFPKAPKRGDALYYRAELARQAGDAAKAAALLEDVPAPKLVDTHAVQLLRGQVNLQIGKFDVAIAALEKVDTAKLTKETQARVLHMRGVAYRGAKNLGAAEKQFQAAYKLNTKLNGEVLLDLARVEALTDRGKDALKTLDKALALKDREVAAEAAHLAGDLAYKADDFIAAIRYYNVVLTGYQSTKHFQPCVIATLWSRSRAKQHDALLADFRQYVDSLPQSDRVVAWYLAGQANKAKGQVKEAAPLLKAAADARANTGIEDRALYALAECQFEQGLHSAVAATVQRLATEHPKSTLIANGQFLLASSEAKAGTPAQAVARLTKMVQAGAGEPYYAIALLKRAQLVEQQSSDADAAKAALADYRALLSFAKSRPGAITDGQWNQAGLRVVALSYALKDYAGSDKAAADLLARKGIDPKIESEALFRRALAQVKLKGFDDALKTLAQLVDRHPKSSYVPQARYYRGMLLMALKKTDAAVTELQAVSKAPDLPAPLRAKALRMLSRHMRATGSQENSAAALLKLEQIKGGLSYADQLWLGRYFVAKGDQTKALEYLARVLKAKSQITGKEYAEALLLAGMSLRELGTTSARKDAIDAFKKVVALGQGFELQARLEVGRTQAMLGQNQAALDEFQPLFGQRDTRIVATAIYESARVHRQIAMQRTRADDTAAAANANKEAALLFRRLVVLYHYPQLSPLPERSYIELAEIAYEAQDKAGAAKEYTSLSKRYPGGDHAVYAKAMLALLDDQRADAKHLLATLAKKAKSKEGASMDEELKQRVERRTKLLETRP